MMRRCSAKATKNYLAKGIKLCAEWLDYEEFRQWAITHGYKETLSIERINSDGDYEPSNCEWVTLSENVRRAQKGRKAREEWMVREILRLTAEVNTLKKQLEPL